MCVLAISTRCNILGSSLYFVPIFQQGALPKGAHAVLQGLLGAILRLAVGSQNLLGLGNVWGNLWRIADPHSGGGGMFAMIQCGRKEKSYGGPLLVVHLCIYIYTYVCNECMYVFR